MKRALLFLLKFGIVTVLATILMTFVWELLLTGRIYRCTDEAGLGYLQPGDWVHGNVEIVTDVDSARSRAMDEPDVMLKGWSTRKLWGIWLLMFGTTIATALMVAGRRLFPDEAPSIARKP